MKRKSSRRLGLSPITERMTRYLEQSRTRFVGPPGRVGVVFRKVRVHVIPGLGTLDEDVRLRPKPARVVERADPDPDHIGPRRYLQEQHAAAFRTERPRH